MNSNTRTLLTLLRREFYRFARLTKQTIFPPLVTTLLFIVIFGFSLGGNIREVAGWPYILYILPGLAAQGVIINAYSNTSTSVYAARFDRSIENWLTAPIGPLQFVMALIAGGVVRGLIIGVMTLALAMVVVHLPMVSPGLVILWMIAIGVIFACLGIISGLRADSWDKLATMTNFVLTPGIYLGGVFYSIHLLPEPWQTISRCNPFFYCIESLRAAVLGTSEVSFALASTVVIGAAAAMVLLCWYLLKIGYRLVR